jgi:hypothetical protein
MRKYRVGPTVRRPEPEHLLVVKTLAYGYKRRQQKGFLEIEVSDDAGTGPAS